jgi:hypothetical protein
MALVTGTLVVNGVREEGVEAETYQEGFANLSG